MRGGSLACQARASSSPRMRLASPHIGAAFLPLWPGPTGQPACPTERKASQLQFDLLTPRPAAPRLVRSGTAHPTQTSVALRNRAEPRRAVSSRASYSSQGVQSQARPTRKHAMPSQAMPSETEAGQPNHTKPTQNNQDNTRRGKASGPGQAAPSRAESRAATGHLFFSFQSEVVHLSRLHLNLSCEW